MNIVFFGTSKFAVPSLNKLITSEHEILSVVTQPDRKKGRRLVVSKSPVKEAALKNKLDILQPEKLDRDFINKLKSLKPDIFVITAFGHILKKEILEIPSIYSINLHASLLPKYRGAAPINWAIMNGETETGVTIIRMNERMDEGDIISERKISIKESDTAASLSEKLSIAGSELLMGTLKEIEGKKENMSKQNGALATYARKLKKEDGRIDWKKEALGIHNMVRALTPWPGAYTKFNNRVLKIWKTEVLDRNTGKPGEVIKAEGKDLIIGTGGGDLRILEVQIEAGKRMSASSFLRGHRLKRGTFL